MADYCTIAELKARIGIGDTVDDTLLTNAVTTTTTEINKFCGRVFTTDSAATARVYPPDSRYLVRVDDFYTTTDLVVKTDDNDDGTYETTWTITTDYTLEPVNGVADGESGWPYYKIRAVGSRQFPTWGRRDNSVQVTAKWGWAAVPAPVHDAALILAEEGFKLKDSPFGVGGYGQFGIIRVRDNPMAARRLNPYRRYALLVG